MTPEAKLPEWLEEALQRQYYLKEVKGIQYFDFYLRHFLAFIVSECERRELNPTPQASTPPASTVERDAEMMKMWDEISDANGDLRLRYVSFCDLFDRIFDLAGASRRRVTDEWLQDLWREVHEGMGVDAFCRAVRGACGGRTGKA